MRIRIDITSDRADSGKTTVAALITKALREHGFTKLQLTCRDGDLNSLLTKDHLPPIEGLREQPVIEVVDNNRRLELGRSAYLL